MTSIEITISSIKQLGVHVELSKYKPGGGWTRYSVTVGDWHDIKKGMSRRECYLYLQGVYDMLRVLSTTKNKKALGPKNNC